MLAHIMLVQAGANTQAPTVDNTLMPRLSQRSCEANTGRDRILFPKLYYSHA